MSSLFTNLDPDDREQRQKALSDDRQARIRAAEARQQAQEAAERELSRLNKRKKFNANLTVGLIERLHAHSSATGDSINAIICAAIDEYIPRPPDPS